MFEEYIDKKINDYVGLFDAKKDRILLSEIRTNPSLPRPFKTFFEGEVDWWIYSNQFERKSHPNFDMHDNEMVKVLSELDTLFKHKAHLTHKDLSELISSSVKLTINYLCRPRTTLNWFIFKDNENVNIPTIIKKMHYFYDYKYLYDGFLKSLEESNISNSEDAYINTDNFQDLISEIDENYIFDLNPSQFIELVEPLYYFFNIIDENSNELVVPTEALMIFFDDKGISPIVNVLEKKFIEEKTKLITRDELLDFINFVIGEAEEGNIDENGEIEYIPQEKVTISKSEIPHEIELEDQLDELIVAKEEEFEVIEDDQTFDEINLSTNENISNLEDELNDILSDSGLEEFGDDIEIKDELDGNSENSKPGEEILETQVDLDNLDFLDTLGEFKYDEDPDEDLKIPSIDLSEDLSEKSPLNQTEVDNLEDLLDSLENDKNEVDKSILSQTENEFNNPFLEALKVDEVNEEPEFNFEDYKEYGMTEEEIKELLKNG